MKRPLPVDNSHMNKKINGCDKQQRKHSLRNSILKPNLKKRRRASNRIISTWIKRKTKRRSKLNNSSLKNNTNGQTPRRSSIQRYPFPTEINLPNWERISPNIDKILSNEHTKSGVYAHEIHLIQQELEALLSMSLIRENLLHSNDMDQRTKRIEQHQQAESIYLSKNIPYKPILPLINPQHGQQNNSHIFLDRQVSMTPIADSRADAMWSDIDAYYHDISSNDLSTIKSLIDFDKRLKDKLTKYRNDYKSHKLTKVNITEQLNKETYPDLLNISQIDPLVTHYRNRTTIERFQTKLYDYALSDYKTPTTNHRRGRPSLKNLKPHINHNKSLPVKSTVNAPLSKNLIKRIELVHDYLTDQHPCLNKNKKRKTTKRNNSTDLFESKLSTLITLLQECSSLSSCALRRASVQINNEKNWEKLNTIQNEIQSFIEKIEMTGDCNNNINTKKTLKTLDNLLKDWKKHEDDFDHQFEQLFS